MSNNEVSSAAADCNDATERQPLGRGCRPCDTRALPGPDIQPQLTPDVGVAGRVHGTAVLGQAMQSGKTSLGEVGCGPAPACAHLDEPTLGHALDSRRQLGLARARPAAPGVQHDAVGDRRVLAEARVELAVDQVALGRGERGSRGECRGGRAAWFGMRANLSQRPARPAPARRRRRWP